MTKRPGLGLGVSLTLIFIVYTDLNDGTYTNFSFGFCGLGSRGLKKSSIFQSIC